MIERGNNGECGRRRGGDEENHRKLVNNMPYDDNDEMNGEGGMGDVMRTGVHDGAKWCVKESMMESMRD